MLRDFRVKHRIHVLLGIGAFLNEIQCILLFLLHMPGLLVELLGAQPRDDGSTATQ